MTWGNRSLARGPPDDNSIGFCIGWTNRKAPEHKTMGNNDSDDDGRKRQQREEDERERNRREVQNRKRQWEVVESDDEGEAKSYSGSRSRSNDSSREDRDRRRHKKHKKKSSKSRHRDRSSSESSSSRSRSRHHHKKDRKKHHRSKDRKKRSKRHHKDKKSKKHRKKSSRHEKEEVMERKQFKDDSDGYTSSSLSDNEREILEKNMKQSSGTNATSSSSGGGGGGAYFGKYGVINASDFHSNTKVKSSFDRWLQEIKGIADFNGPKYELMEYFKEYVEDYNTATLPHAKYYDYDKWEMNEYARKKREAEQAAASKDGAGGGNVALDELRHKEEMNARAKEKKLEATRLVQHMMTADKREEMKHQAKLRHEMAVAYKTGDEETRKRLEKRLKPEEKLG